MLKPYSTSKYFVCCFGQELIIAWGDRPRCVSHGAERLLLRAPRSLNICQHLHGKSGNKVTVLSRKRRQSTETKLEAGSKHASKNVAVTFNGEHACYAAAKLIHNQASYFEVVHDSYARTRRGGCAPQTATYIKPTVCARCAASRLDTTTGKVETPFPVNFLSISFQCPVTVSKTTPRTSAKKRAP